MAKTAGIVKRITLASKFCCPKKPIKPFPCPPVQLSDGIFVISENNESRTTKMFEGIRKSSMDFPENRFHKIPAKIHPAERRIKYKALVAEICGYDDQREVNKNHIDGRRKKEDG